MVLSILNDLYFEKLSLFWPYEIISFLFPNLVLKVPRKSLNGIVLMSVEVQRMKKLVLSQKFIYLFELKYKFEFSKFDISSPLSLRLISKS